MPTTPDHRAKVRRSRAETRERMIEVARDLLRTRSYAELKVDEVMRPLGQNRTVFYRHFDDLPDLLARASVEAIEQLYAAQVAFSDPVPADREHAIESAIGQAVAVYAQHGPLLRGVREAGAADPSLSATGDELRRRFDALTEQALREMAGPDADPDADLTERARALTLMNEAYLLDAFGREPRVSPETAVRTLTDLWKAIAL